MHFKDKKLMSRTNNRVPPDLKRELGHLSLCQLASGSPPPGNRDMLFSGKRDIVLF